MKMLYRIKNETLEDIAAKFSIPKSEILKINLIKSEDIKKGKILILDKKTGVRYTVRPFDTIEKIAAQFNLNAKAICDYNGITEVFLGELIYIPINEKNQN